MRNRQIFVVLLVVLLLASCGLAPESFVGGRIEKVEGGLLVTQGDHPWK